MFSIKQLSLHYGGRTLFEDINISVGDGEKIGLAGRNGAGKSSLLKIIAGETKNFSGQIEMPAGSRLGFLHQDMVLPKGKTVMEEAMTAFDEIRNLELEIFRMQEELVARDDYESDGYMKLIQDLHDSEEHFRMLGGHDATGDIEKVLIGLGFKRTDFEKLVDIFSGGWKMRIELAKMLLRKPDILLLDEPTNHLDIESILWLEGFLKQSTATVIVISHDRMFLDNVTKRTVEIDGGKIFDYKAPYTQYLVLRAERQEILMKSFKNQQAKIAETERLIERFRAKASKAKFAQSLIKQLDKTERIELDETNNSSMNIRFLPAPRSGEVVLHVEGLSKNYGPKTVLDKVDLQIIRGEKVAFVGKNGEGKTTLSKIIAGVEKQSSGKCEIGHNVHIAYYAQNQAEIMSPNMTLLETIDKDAPHEMRPRLRAILGSFLFAGDDVDKKVSVLSGGERARLAMACLLLRPCNLLILDEPTNHLDIISKEVLKEAIESYEGTLLVVSHDRDFLDGLTTRTVEFRDGKLHDYLGDMNYFLEKRQVDNMRDVSLGSINGEVPKAVAAAQPQRVLSTDEQKEQKRLQRKVQDIEKRINDIERQKKQIESKLGQESVYGTPEYTKLTQEYAAMQTKLDAENSAWEEAYLELESFESV